MAFDRNKDLFLVTDTGEWLDAQFEDEESGEIFFVELRKEAGQDVEDFIGKCQEIADENFDNAIFLGLVDAETAETLGYDTY